MPESNPPPTYRWAVAVAETGSSLTVEAAYPLFDEGHMVLKDSAHKIVFAAESGTGCTFERLAAAAPETPELGSNGNSTRLTVGLVTHIAGPEVRVGSRFRQRCAWCGVILADSATHGPAMWAQGDLVRSDGDAWFVTGNADWADLPAGSCAAAEIDAGAGM